MIAINYSDGTIRFNNLVVSPGSKLSSIADGIVSKNLELWSSHNEWTSYRINSDKEFIVILMFFNEIIKSVEIYPNLVSENDDELQIALEKLGGENDYHWGTVELNNDHKAGYKSIVVHFRQGQVSESKPNQT
jgi:hypothetical protein